MDGVEYSIYVPASDDASIVKAVSKFCNTNRGVLGLPDDANVVEACVRPVANYVKSTSVTKPLAAEKSVTDVPVSITVSYRV